MIPETGTLVFIEWYDIVVSTGWEEGGEDITLKDMECWAVGFIIAADEDIIHLCAIRGASGENGTNARFSVPVGCIKGIHTMEIP